MIEYTEEFVTGGWAAEPMAEARLALREDMANRARTVELRRSRRWRHRFARWIGVRWGGLPTASQTRMMEAKLRVPPMGVEYR